MNVFCFCLLYWSSKLKANFTIPLSIWPLGHFYLLLCHELVQHMWSIFIAEARWNELSKVYACEGSSYYLTLYTELGWRMVWKSPQWSTPRWRKTPVIDHRKWHWKLLALQDNLMHAGDRGWWRKKNQDEFCVSMIFSLPGSITVVKLLSLYCACPLSLITFRRLKRAVRVGHAQ